MKKITIADILYWILLIIFILGLALLIKIIFLGGVE